MRVLFICQQNALRSPTAERVFSGYEGLEVKSAGLSDTASKCVTPELLAWSDVVFVMEKSHLNRLRKKFSGSVQDKVVRILHIPDDYDYMDPQLIEIIKMRVTPFLPLSLCSHDGL